MASKLPSTMRAAAWTSNAGGIEKNFKVNTNAPLPKTSKTLPPDSTLVRVSYASLNPVDYKVAEAPIVGSYFLSRIPGLDFAGTVVESKLAHLKPGEPVFGQLAMPAFGSLGEYVVVPKQSTIPVPDGVKLEDAATIGVAGLTAYQCIEPFVKSGDKIFINGGSGGVGTFGIQIAKALGCHVTTTCSGPNVELCKSLGADEVIDYRTENVVESLKRSGKQFDLFVDNVFADTSLYWQSHHYLKPQGRFITVAGSPSLPFMLDMAMIMMLPTWLGGGQRKFQFVTCTANAAQYEKIANWLKEGTVKPVIEKVYDLGETGQAYERLKSGRTRGKLVVKI